MLLVVLSLLYRMYMLLMVRNLHAFSNDGVVRLNGNVRELPMVLLL